MREGEGEEARRSMLKQGEQDMVRLILQALQGMGYLESSLCLQRESGVMLQSEGEKLRALRRDVMEGEWRKILSELEREDWASTSLKYAPWRC